MSVEGQSLPFSFDYPFRFWSYSKSHAKLILRGRPGEEYDQFVDVVFTSVLGVKLASSYQKLFVSAANDTFEIDNFLQMPGRYERGYLNLDVSDGMRRGFVVCKRVRVRRGIDWQD